jgi:hypothetical protein
MDSKNFIVGEVQTFGYTVDPNILDQVYKTVSDFQNEYGKRPSYLLLGYGTYLGLCLAFTTRQITYNKGYINKIVEFAGIPIQIDPACEYRIQTIYSKDVWEESIKALASHKTTFNMTIK